MRALVCSDGSVLRADGARLPTLDTLCVDSTREPVPLEIGNRSGRVGIVGAFHALYAAGRAEPVAGQVRPSDVPGLEGERFACDAVGAGRLDLLGPGDAVSFSLRALPRRRVRRSLSLTTLFLLTLGAGCCASSSARRDRLPCRGSHIVRAVPDRAGGGRARALRTQQADA